MIESNNRVQVSIQQTFPEVSKSTPIGANVGGYCPSHPMIGNNFREGEQLRVQIKSRAVSIIMVVILLIVAACQPQVAPSPPDPVTVQLTWTHSAQFAGLYAAAQNGDYAAEGLDVTFLEGGPNVNRLKSVLAGEAQFGMASGPELLQARAEGKPVRAIATILRRDPFAFFALADSGISRPQDFKDKRIQIRPRARPFLRTMMARVGIAPDQYTEDNEAVFTDLYAGEVDVVSGFMTAQLIEAEQAGYELNIIYPGNYGVHFYSDSIFTTDDLITANPELVTRFLRATLKGWTFAIETPAEAGPLVLEYNPVANPTLAVTELTASVPLVHTGRDRVGWMRAEVWQEMHDMLLEQELLEQPLDPRQVYTMQFLEAVYENDRP